MRIVYRWLVLALLAPGLASAQVLLREPGYVAIDGSYYVYDLPRQDNTAVPAELHPRNSEGFYLRSLLAVGDCTPGDGLAGASLSSLAGLRHAEQLDLAAAARVDLLVNDQALSSVRIASCDGAVVLFARSASGTTTCAGAVGFPFRRGQCTAVDAADPGLVFFDAFEIR